jgi:hypothetical protein
MREDPVGFEYNYNKKTHELTNELWSIMNTFGKQMYMSNIDPIFVKNEIEILEEGDSQEMITNV